ncbi:FleQ protein [Aeromonas encheleia]|uniref:sigma-54 dependent transcriptional regulator n=2 Tax=Aeromonadaceae TaxID=84642 RepID=UPI000F72142C|nr:sigma-54 dependent transcriptional regulator [Aeromonas encheleia]VEG95513.1 FleQ protein [Aeromonas encheleia]
MEMRTLLCVNTSGVWCPSSQASSLGWRFCSASSPQEAFGHYAQHAPRVGLVLLNEGATEALEALFRQTCGTMVWVALAPPHLLAQPRMQELLLNYCFDYHSLPVGDERLLAVLGHAFGIACLRGSVHHPCRHGKETGGLIGASPVMQQIMSRVERLAKVDSSVILQGESGTGKELVARQIHRHSLRADGPFVAINCGAIPPSLIQSELFGHEKGAFTGACRRHIGCVEMAHHGILFLDEIGDLPLPMQVNLLRFLQERTIVRVGGAGPIEVDIRVIAATNRVLDQEMEQGHFRSDLFYRLCVLDLTLPPLRERGEDIMLLAQYFLTKMGGILNPRVQGFTAGAMRQMLQYHWPGNVRELKNRLERALVLCEGQRIDHQDLGLALPQAEGGIRPLNLVRAEAECEAVRRALVLCGNNVTEAARHLGISRLTLYRVLERSTPTLPSEPQLS